MAEDFRPVRQEGRGAEDMVGVHVGLDEVADG
jgi:hypothetical protein